MRNSESATSGGTGSTSSSMLSVTCHLVLALHFDAVGLQGGDQSDVVQHRRVQPVRQQPEGLGDAGRPPLDRAQQLLEPGALGIVALPAQEAEVHGQARHFLAHAVVQVAGDARTLGLLAG